MREWIITNGIGGYASSTDFGGMNTRRYHGLLIASLNPPAERKLILSKVDESLEIGGCKYNLYTNDSNGQISEGYTYLSKFEKGIIPIYTYKINDVIIEKSICMIYGKNAVIVLYRIMNRKAKVKLNLTPVVNYRDFHSEKHDFKFNYNQIIDEGKIQLEFDKASKINIGVKGSNYIIHKDDYFKSMDYEIEKQRGFDYEENHLVPGTFQIEIKPNEDKEITFICAMNDEKFGVNFNDLNKIDGKKVIESEVERISKQVIESKLLLNLPKSNEDQEIYKDIVKKYIIASDNFIVYRKSNNLHTIIAGYPWFLDWGRDSLISFEGLLLMSNKIKIAEEVLLTYANKIKKGIVPNGFSEYDGKPLYNSVDASLLLFEAVNKYLEYTKNYDFVRDNLYEKLKNIIDSYIDGTNLDGNNIYLDEKDFLLSSGTEKTQNTWMDAKVNNIAITPRNGKAVEINAMWYNSLRIMQSICQNLGKFISKFEYAYLAQKCQKSFKEKFYNPNKQCLYDVIGDDKIRPNQIFALGLSYTVLDCKGEIARQTFLTVTHKLLNKYGLQTLAADEPGFVPVYEGGPAQRDASYHQGPTWPWLLGPYYTAINNLINAEDNENFRMTLENTLTQFKINVANTYINELTRGNTVGSICEIYDSINPKLGKGAFAQAWSVSEIFKILLKNGGRA